MLKRLYFAASNNSAILAMGQDGVISCVPPVRSSRPQCAVYKFRNISYSLILFRCFIQNETVVSFLFSNICDEHFHHGEMKTLIQQVSVCCVIRRVKTRD